MYKVLNMKTGELVGYVNSPRYVKKNPTSGAYIQTDEEGAEAVAVFGTLYNILNKPVIDSAIDTVDIVTEDDAAQLFLTRKTAYKTEKDFADESLLIEDTMIENELVLEDRLTAIEEALCDLDK